jgi:outer membrane protein assembly factor BamB
MKTKTRLSSLFLGVLALASAHAGDSVRIQSLGTPLRTHGLCYSPDLGDFFVLGLRQFDGQFFSARLFEVSSNGAVTEPCPSPFTRGTDSLRWFNGKFFLSESDSFTGVYKCGFYASSTACTWSNLAIVRSGDIDNSLKDLTFGNGIYCGVGNGTVFRSPLLARSLDGQLWTSSASIQGSPTGFTLNAVAYGGGLFAAVGTGGRILISTDAASWVTRGLTSAFTEALNGVCYGKGYFVAVGDFGQTITGSGLPDWQVATTLATFNKLNAVCYGDGRFVAVGNSGTWLTSDDGTIWDQVNLGTFQEDISDVAYGNGAFVGITHAGSILVLTTNVAPLEPVTINSQPASQSVLIGASVEFRVTAQGSYPLTWQWLRNGAALIEGGRFQGVKGAVLRITSAELTDAGDYQVVVSNSLGAVDSATAVLTVRRPPGELLWTFQTPTTTRSAATSPALGADGTVYIGLNYTEIYAVDGLTGNVKWVFETGYHVNSSPALGPDGTVYVGSSNNKVYALNGATGAKRWEFTTGGSVESSPTIGADGTVYVASYDGALYALDGATGLLKSKFVLGGLVVSSPAIGADGTVFIGSGDGTFYALYTRETQLAEKWRYTTGSGPIESSPAIGADGTVYVGANQRLYALDGATGIRRWQSYELGDMRASATIGPDGAVYVATDSSINALDALTGSTKWTFLAGDTAGCSPAVGSDGTLYVSSSDKYLYALEAATGALKWRFVTGGLAGWRSSPTIGSDGSLYLGVVVFSSVPRTDYAKLFALYTGSTLASSPWPMWARDARHTGSAEISTGPVVILSQPHSKATPAGSKVEFRVVAGGSRPLEWQWFRNGVALAEGSRFNGVNSALLTIDPVRLEDAGDYQLLVSNTSGALTSSIANLWVWRPLGDLAWTFQAGGGIHSSPAIGPDGTVYVGSNDKKVYALNGATGSKKWEFLTGGTVSSSPAIGANGTVYVGSVDRNLYALNGTTGSKRWQYSMNQFFTASPAIGADGTIYMLASRDSQVCALNGLTGVKKWELPVGNGSSTPAIAADGTVYVQGDDKKLHALDGVTGGQKWEFLAGGKYMYFAYSPAIGLDGTVYVGTSDYKVYAVNGATGSKLWEFLTGSGVSASPAVGLDGTVYVGSGDGKVYALDGTTGAKKWEFITGASIDSSPAVAADGTVYVGSLDNKLYALDGTTGVKRWEFTTGGSVGSSPAIGVDGMVYVGSSDGKLYALRGGIPLADSAWPMWGKDPQHTGRAVLLRPGRVIMELAGSQATIRWSGDFTLQAASDVKGPWADLTGATSGYQVNPVGQRQFFRLRLK